MSGKHRVNADVVKLGGNVLLGRTGVLLGMVLGLEDDRIKGLVPLFLKVLNDGARHPV
jgi:hypothetical protein